jgi:hypothetical protein
MLIRLDNIHVYKEVSTNPEEDRFILQGKLTFNIHLKLNTFHCMSKIISIY